MPFFGMYRRIVAFKCVANYYVNQTIIAHTTQVPAIKKGRNTKVFPTLYHIVDLATWHDWYF